MHSWLLLYISYNPGLDTVAQQKSAEDMLGSPRFVVRFMTQQLQRIDEKHFHPRIILLTELEPQCSKARTLRNSTLMKGNGNDLRV